VAGLLVIRSSDRREALTAGRYVLGVLVGFR
jgi:hypothetical protein